jgi:hypothetical protein
MQLTMFDENEVSNPQLSSGKTSQGYLARMTMPSVVFSLGLSVNQNLLRQQGSDGNTQVLSLGQRGRSLGESSTLNISDWPNDASVCLLSQVLEQTLMSDKYYLSSTACKGILRRAEKRGKALPPMLRQALQQVTIQAEAHNQAK